MKISYIWPVSVLTSSPHFMKGVKFLLILYSFSIFCTILTLAHGREHITPALKEPHWLPVRQQIDHKIMSLAYKCYKELIPQYVPAQPLCSSLQPHLQIPSAFEEHTKKQFGFRDFPNSAPMLWNALPQSGKITWRCSSDVWKPTCSLNKSALCVFFF